jgi:hypothetical protein
MASTPCAGRDRSHHVPHHRRWAQRRLSMSVARPAAAPNRSRSVPTAVPGTVAADQAIQAGQLSGLADGAGSRPGQLPPGARHKSVAGPSGALRSATQAARRVTAAMALAQAAAIASSVGPIATARPWLARAT